MTTTLGPVDQAGLEDVAARLAPLLAGGDWVRLVGPIGAGKTTFARALIRARAGHPMDVPSPTFTLIQDYPLPGLTIRHVDLYRIDDPDEVIEMGLDDDDPVVAFLVEWPERGGGHLPADGLAIRIDPAGADLRRLRLEAGPSFASRIRQIAGE